MSKIRSGTSLTSLAGEDFGPYRLVRRLGVGGMAETYEAIRRGPSGFTQHVCLKLVLPFFRDNDDFIRLFEREARLAAKLRHSNIVGVIDFGAIDGIPYMALELVDGADLRVLLDGQDTKRLPHDLVALIGAEIAAALEHAHSPRFSTSDGGVAIVHRDVSPSNVLISRQGEIFLSDFGVAKAISGTSRQQSAVKGKVPYMSPEQLRAEPLDGRSDLFALGVVLFEALGGCRPYEGAHDPATIMLTLAGDHPSLRGLAPEAPAKLCDIIESLIQSDLESRPESASVLIDLLDEFVPSPRARRQLGERVDECRPAKPGISTEEALELIGDDSEGTPPRVTTGVQRTGSVGDASVSAPGAASAKASDDRPHSYARKGVALVLFLGALVASGLFLWPLAQESLNEEPTLPPAAPVEATEPRDPAPAAVDEPTDSPSAQPTDSLEADSTPKPAAADPAPKDVAPARPARLTVIVFPWGNVWINGKRKGAAPLKNEPLKPGRYKIGVGQDAPFESQTIRLRAGQRKTLDFDLTK